MQASAWTRGSAPYGDICNWKTIPTWNVPQRSKSRQFEHLKRTSYTHTYTMFQRRTEEFGSTIHIRVHWRTSKQGTRTNTCRVEIWKYFSSYARILYPLETVTQQKAQNAREKMHVRPVVCRWIESDLIIPADGVHDIILLQQIKEKAHALVWESPSTSYVEAVDGTKGWALIFNSCEGQIDEMFARGALQSRTSGTSCPMRRLISKWHWSSNVGKVLRALYCISPTDKNKLYGTLTSSARGTWDGGRGAQDSLTTPGRRKLWFPCGTLLKHKKKDVHFGNFLKMYKTLRQCDATILPEHSRPSALDSGICRK